MSAEEKPLLLSVPAAARLLGVPLRSAQREVQLTGALGGVPVAWVSGRRYVPRLALERAVNGEAQAS